MSTGTFELKTVVVGAGPAGLAAACAAAESGSRVRVLDDTPWLGGQIWRGEQTRPVAPEARRWIERFQKSGAVLLDRTTAIAAPKPGLILAECAGAPLQISYDRLILATGAREL